jgi:hypothetical protein
MRALDLEGWQNPEGKAACNAAFRKPPAALHRFSNAIAGEINPWRIGVQGNTNHPAVRT